MEKESEQKHIPLKDSRKKRRYFDLILQKKQKKNK